MAGEVSVKALSRSPSHLLKRAAQYANILYMEEAGRLGLTQRQYTVLVAVEQCRMASQIHLVKLTGIDRSTLAEMVSRLVAQGYLARKPCPDDARVKQVELTEAGRRALMASRAFAGDVDRKLLAAVPTEQRKAFLAGLAALASRLPAGEADNAGTSKAAVSRGRSQKARR